MYNDTLYFKGWYKWNIKFQNYILSFSCISKRLQKEPIMISIVIKFNLQKYEKNQKVYGHIKNNEII